MSHIFANKIRLDSNDYVVEFVLWEDDNGNRFYDHELTEIINPDWLAPGRDTSDEALGHRTNRGDVMNLLRDKLGVNDGTGRILFQSPFHGEQSSLNLKQGTKTGRLFQKGEIQNPEEKLAEETEEWKKTVEVLQRKPSFAQLMLTQTPLAMHLVGADFKELYAAPHVFDGMFPGSANPNHNTHPNIDAEVLKKIPKALADPIAIFQDPSNASKFVFMLDITDANKATVIVPILFEAKKYRAEINLALTVFSKEKNGKPEPQWFVKNAQDIVYINKKKDREFWKKNKRWVVVSGSNSLWDVSNAYNHKILTESDLGKLKNQYPGIITANNLPPARRSPPLTTGT